jgi:hypothetical protein
MAASTPSSDVPDIAPKAQTGPAFNIKAPFDGTPPPRYTRI